MDVRINVLSPDIFIQASLRVAPGTVGEPPHLRLQSGARSLEPKSILDALNAAGACPGHELLWSEDIFSPQIGCKFGLYPLARDSFFGLNYPELRAVDVSFAWFSKEGDPFDVAEETSPTWDAKTPHPVLDEILAHAARVARLQQRLWYFFVLFFGDKARLIRVDHVGIVTTTAFPYATSQGPLTTFLWHFAHASPVHRGHDPSVQRVVPTSEAGQKMLSRAALESARNPGNHVSQAFIESLDDACPWWRIEVHDARAGRVYPFVVGKPVYDESGMVGSGKHGYIALDLANLDGPFVYLEDTWRMAGIGDEQEGNVLRVLNANSIPFVRTVLCHGDLPDQVTMAPNLVPRYGGQHPMPPIFRRHYRVVVGEVCKPVEEFSNGKELVKGVWCCLKAHEGAWLAGIVHPNVHPANISLYESPSGEWVGMLGGWTSAGDEYRTPQHKETWMFASKRLLDNPTRTTAISDALESFFNVLLHVAIRFLPNNIACVSSFIHAYFEAYSRNAQDLPRAGLLKSQAMTRGILNLASPDSMERNALHFVTSSQDRHPINDVFDELLSWIRTSYTPGYLLDSRDALRKFHNLESHTAMGNLLLTHIGRQDWPSQDRCLGNPERAVVSHA
ncbi:hypothetical protein BD311DRAFT_151171 [Dichomitus squalens]|uniref:Fungal-type protein kinase domain-containing protein n=1 Tax=Dichomitus squalens TaxID=114155 RepID=A0A4Q9MTE7_9APHY|nr:hypothetical protein BD311DRAFT_151171 [Dichomitus squalens]